MALQFRKSTFSQYVWNRCVEVAVDEEKVVHVRDSKERNGPVLRFTGPEWDAFIKGVKNGEFEAP